jgi:ketosteroid isomerase-like protein
MGQGRLGHLKDLYDEDVVFHSSIVDIVGKTVVGHEALRRFMTEIQEEWTSLRWELEEIFEAPRGIVTFHRVVGIGRTTGLEVTKAVTGIFEVRDGRTSASGSTPTARKPSKPPGCRSRRCTRRSTPSERGLSDAPPIEVDSTPYPG